MNVDNESDRIDLPSLQEVTYMNETFAKCNQVTFESKCFVLSSLPPPPPPFHTSFSFMTLDLPNLTTITFGSKEYKRPISYDSVNFSKVDIIMGLPHKHANPLIMRSMWMIDLVNIEARVITV